MLGAEKRQPDWQSTRIWGCLMGIRISEVYEALMDAGTSEAKAKTTGLCEAAHQDEPDRCARKQKFTKSN